MARLPPAPSRVHNDTERLLGSPFYSASLSEKVNLMLSNQGPHDMPVTISLFSLGGKPFVTPVQILKGHEVRSVDVNALVTSAGWAFRKGSLQVSYVGRRLELGGLVTLTDDLRSLVFEQELAEAKDVSAQECEQVS